jgi:membrane-bound lytic murein transglycosylase D
MVAAVSRAEVERQMLEIIGDSMAAAVTSEGEWLDISSDLDIISFASHDRVVFFVDAFSNASRERTRAFLSRGSRYEPMIRAKLRAASLPEDLYYLAFIESGYVLDAYSSAAAVGMWQFRTATA